MALVEKFLIANKERCFFVAVNYFSTKREGSFKNGILSKNTIEVYVKIVCDAVHVSGTGVKKTMTTHGIRGTVITTLFEAGHADSSVSLRRGHRYMRLLKHYQNLRGELGLNQQMDILGGALESEICPLEGEETDMQATEDGAGTKVEAKSCNLESKDRVQCNDKAMALGKASGEDRGAEKHGAPSVGVLGGGASIVRNVTINVNLYSSK